MRAITLSLLMLSVSFPAIAQLQDSARSDQPLRSDRSPAVAVGLSVLLPGSGQLYNRQPGKAAVHFGLFAGAVGWVAARDIGHTNADIKPLDWLSVTCVGFAYIWSALDAGLTAGVPGESAADAQVHGPPAIPLFSVGICTLHGNAAARIELRL